MGKHQPTLWLFTPKTKKSQNVHHHGALSGWATPSSCTPVLVPAVEDKVSNQQVLVWNPSDHLHSLNVTAEVLATTLPPLSVSGWLLLKKTINSLLQMRKS